jgi:hypothetical protein
MPTFDEDLRTRIRAAAPGASGRDDLLDVLTTRKRRRATARKLGTIATVAILLLGTIGGFALLDRGPRANEPATNLPDNGGLVVSLQDSSGTHLYLLPAKRLDLNPADGASADRADLVQLTNAQDVWDDQPSVSPDGSTIAFVRLPDCPSPEDCTQGSLMSMGLDGTGLHRVVDLTDPASVSWSPDGTWLAVRRTMDSFWLVHPDGSALHEIPVNGIGGIQELGWSADSSHLLLVAARNGEQPDIWSVTLDGSDRTNVTNTPDTAELGPSESPDGRWILFRNELGIYRMPTTGGPAELLVPSPPPDEADLARPMYSPDGTVLTFLIEGPSTSTVYALLNGDTQAFPVAPGSSYAWQPAPVEASQSPSVDNLGLPYPVCGVSTMPIATELGAGAASVFTEAADEGCPKGDKAVVDVGVDVDGDGVIDATAGPLSDCWFVCEAFASPDMDGDGRSEVAVSTMGADGYGISVFAVTASPPAIEPLVRDHEPFQFAWVNVATHAESAHCELADNGTMAFVLDNAEWDPSGASVTQEFLHVDGSIVTKDHEDTYTTTLDQAPVPSEQLCGSPIYGSAAGVVPTTAPAEGRDIGHGSST